MATSQRVASSTVVEGSRPVLDRGKRKVIDSAEAEQSCKFKEDPLVLRAALDIEAKRRKCDKRIAQRQREKQKLEEAEKEL